MKKVTKTKKLTAVHITVPHTTQARERLFAALEEAGFEVCDLADGRWHAGNFRPGYWVKEEFQAWLPEAQ